MPYRPNVTDKEQNDIETQEDSSSIRVFGWKDVNGQTQVDPDVKIIKAYDLNAQDDAAGSPSSVIAQSNNRAQLIIGNHNDKPAVFADPGKANNRQPLIPPSSTATATATMKAVLVAVFTGGAGYAVGDTVNPNGAFTVRAVFDVATVGPAIGQDDDDYDGAGSNGTFNIGNDGYGVSDVLTMSDGSTVRVDGIMDDGEIQTVSAFTVLTGATTGSGSDNPTLTQVSTTGGASNGFTMTLGDANQAIVTATINTAGDYANPIADPATQDTTSGSGTGATFNVDWGVLAITVTDGGSGYGSAPVVTLSGNATATASVSSGAVASVAVTDAGSGYSITATVSIAAP